jgi:hypothetical protein
LIGERTRIINRMKSVLVPLGIRGFKPQLRKAPQLVETLRTPEYLPIPPNALDEMRRDLARLECLEQAPQTGPMPPSPVPGRISSRSNSARPPSTVSMCRP